MIQPITMYMVVCDNCREHYTDNDSGVMAYPDESSSEYMATESYWLKQDDKHYCPECHYFDDEDELVLNESRKKQ